MRECFQNSLKTWAAITIFWRKISSPIKRFEIRSQKNRERPTSASSHNLRHILINLIQIRSLFPIDLDIDKVLIHHFCHFLIFKALSLHDVTPVASRIPNAQENGLVLRSSQT